MKEVRDALKILTGKLTDFRYFQEGLVVDWRTIYNIFLKSVYEEFN